MAKRRNTAPAQNTVKAGHAPWAIINKDTGLTMALFNPQGKAAALRRVAIRIAQKHDVPFTRVKLIPAGLLGDAERLSSKVYEAPVIVVEEGELVEKDITTILSAPETE